MRGCVGAADAFHKCSNNDPPWELGNIMVGISESHFLPQTRKLILSPPSSAKENRNVVKLGDHNSRRKTSSGPNQGQKSLLHSSLPQTCAAVSISTITRRQLPLGSELRNVCRDGHFSVFNYQKPWCIENSSKIWKQESGPSAHCGKKKEQSNRSGWGAFLTCWQPSWPWSQSQSWSGGERQKIMEHLYLLVNINKHFADTVID